MRKLYRGTVGTGAGTLCYTVPKQTKTDIQDITMSNTTASPISLKIHLVDSGGSVTLNNMMIPNISIPGNTVVQWTGVQHLTSEDFVQAIASAAGISLTISGEEYR